MTFEELKRYRARLFHGASNFDKIERVPHLGSYITWKIIDAGYSFSEAFQDYGIMEKCVRRFVERYPVDALMDTGVRNPFRVIESFGKGYYYYDDDTQTLGVHPYELAGSQELWAYAQNPPKFLWEVAMPRKFEDWQQKTLADWQLSLNEQNAFNAYASRIGRIMAEEYGIPGLTSPACGFPTPAIETLFSSVRGIRGLSMDMRRQPEMVKEAILQMDERGLDPVVAKIYAGQDGPDLDYCFDLTVMMLAHTVLSPRQFESLYWPSLKKLLDAAAEKKKNLRLTIEGSARHLFDYFRDYPKGVLSLLLEQDDIFETRKALPNAALIGGMKTTTLGKGTKEECLALTQRLLEELGGSGGYIFSTDKFISYRNDANGENLKAVCDYVAQGQS